ncbi:Type 1 phosphatases regulator ypi1 [Cladophialophora chaetospira]|uniref:Type 1 phosphatases regulator n=1 Tax=Cladophialophora chaetospira TaxID=386627 RepID=A0AA38XJG3_9EURO|nr:Type 1 phosphatases regulator ypi1 [Cladophialophora chaetospira]
MSSPAITAPASPVQRPTVNSTRNTLRPSGRTHLAPGQTVSRRAAAGSATQTITPEDTASSRSVSPDPLVLRLRGAHDASGSNTTSRRRIQWAEDVIDNEGLGRKSSKVCCIYHKTRAFGESSSEEDSSSDSSSDDSDADGSDSPDDGGARIIGGRRGRKNGRGHAHKHGDDCGHGHSHGKGKGKGKRKPSPNAYEKMPNYNAKQEPIKR